MNEANPTIQRFALISFAIVIVLLIACFVTVYNGVRDETGSTFNALVVSILYIAVFGGIALFIAAFVAQAWFLTAWAYTRRSSNPTLIGAIIRTVGNLLLLFGSGWMVYMIMTRIFPNATWLGMAVIYAGLWSIMLYPKRNRLRLLVKLRRIRRRIFHR